MRICDYKFAVYGFFAEHRRQLANNRTAARAQVDGKHPNLFATPFAISAGSTRQERTKNARVDGQRGKARAEIKAVQQFRE
jgi:hypothetical protein